MISTIAISGWKKEWLQNERYIDNILHAYQVHGTCHIARQLRARGPQNLGESEDIEALGFLYV
jgi:hypothetical protein